MVNSFLEGKMLEDKMAVAAILPVIFGVLCRPALLFR
jgi:hypothetical protein